jgi:hypothetical protein
MTIAIGNCKECGTHIDLLCKHCRAIKERGHILSGDRVFCPSRKRYVEADWVRDFEGHKEGRVFCSECLEEVY